ncbi:inositol monophosphatase family protein [Sphingomonas bacterium]|uniref:inositol monophosphatase family protein n=1 Tax=Sphingomonas bacterium TaxID=1895847 RepID=UPI0020C624DB|nr:inositol monophosphatase family protein [Sphingomonas bacterium]
MGVHPLHGAVERLMVRVGREIVMPSFRALAPDQIMEKGPGDVVTVADRASEDALTEALLALLPGSRVIGEEAVAADAALLDGIDQGTAWIVDPIDGTSNYAEGITPFAIMVALVEEGETQGGWILDPATGRMCHAHRGGGAFIDGARITAKTSGTEPPTAALALTYLPIDVRADIAGRIPDRLIEVPVPRCAGAQYPRLVTGENDIALYWRALPWDHAPGALFLTEAGGRISRFDGAPYRLGEDGRGLIAAATPELWDRARDILIG